MVRVILQHMKNSINCKIYETFLFRCKTEVKFHFILSEMWMWAYTISNLFNSLIA